MSIEVFDLHHTYHKGTPLEFESLKGVSFQLSPGEWISVVGHTGSGKSTLAQHLNGLIQPQRGRVEVDGLSTGGSKRDLREVRRRVGLVFQFPEQQLFADTVYEEIAFGPRNWGFSDEEVRRSVEDAVEAVGLDGSLLDRNPMALSGGQRRRVAIGSVISSNPRYLVLDEPTAGLDAKGVEELLVLLGRLREKGIGICHITHDLEMALEHSSRILVLSKGEVVFWGTPQEAAGFLSERSVDGLVLPEVLELCSRLRARGFNVPLTWDPGRLSRAIEEMRS
ncbi:ABC-type cobalt transport system, ATPase component [Thermanaerovibrio velox DSM 12556]|uniref:ABC-type cobalt transport system, ATPase component n=1 Tax=Thermanaerovibrio velox DSM 12556 TaxID=926567 RepID=H0UQU2_9BACT|nr:ATP-binding cassette domain-containing protein [Thermanaerovibrio velox]EHM09771.1 ABC-type cobalt transport system, ATPase component [Thermanaerovibrio velox DSM 12556]